MFPEKIKITDDLIKLIIDTRKEHDLTAYQLSEKIGKNKSWLPNIENKRTKKISRNDLYLLFNDFAHEDKLRPEQYIVRHLPRNSMIELEDGVTAPCFHVQEMLGVNYWEDYDQLSCDEFNKEIEFHCYGRSDELKKKDVSASIDRLSNLLKGKLNNYDIDKLDEYRMSIDTMEENFIFDFERTLKIYSNDFCSHDPLEYDTNTKQTYLKDLDSLQNTIKITMEFISAKSFVYSFIEGVPKNENYKFFDKIKNWNSLEDSEDEKLYYALEDIKNYHFGLYSYADYYEEYCTIFKTVPQIDYNLIFSKLHEMFELYIGVAKINCSFDFTIPCDSATHEEIEELHRQTDRILFNIEKEVRSKFKNRNS